MLPALMSLLKGRITFFFSKDFILSSLNDVFVSNVDTGSGGSDLHTRLISVTGSTFPQR